MPKILKNVIYGTVGLLVLGQEEWIKQYRMMVSEEFIKKHKKEFQVLNFLSYKIVILF